MKAKKLKTILYCLMLTALIITVAACVKPPQALSTPCNVRIENGILMWDEVEGADEYIVYTSYNGEEATVKTNEYDLSFIQEEGDYKVEVAAVRQGEKGKSQTEWAVVKYTYVKPLQISENLVFTKIEGLEAYEVTKKKNEKLESTVVIPETYNGLPVVKVARGAFIDNMGFVLGRMEKDGYDDVIQKVVLPDTIEEIGEYAFASCVALEEINLPEGIKTIGYRTFFNCQSLSNITLPYSLEAIGDAAFAICHFTEITIPENVNFIGDSAFQNCRNIKQIKLPEQVTVVSDKLFYGCNSLQKVELAEKIENIGNSAFENCTALSQINLPKTLTSIGNYAFENCTALSQINLPKTLTSIGNYSFKNCTVLKQIAFPQTLTSIGLATFYNCESLSSIFFQNIEEIGDGAFENCTALKQIVFPQTLKSIGLSAFRGCDSLSDIIFPENMDNIEYIEKNNFQNTPWYNNLPNGLIIINGKYLYGYKGELPEDGKLVIPQCIEKIITKSTFSGLNVKSVIFECELDEMTNGVFHLCTYLEEVVLKGNIKSIPKDTFYACKSLTKVVLPDSVENIGERAFANTKITNLDFLPASVKTIEEKAFYNNSALESADLPKNAVLTGECVFSGCKNLTSAHIYSGTYLPDSTFKGCEKLTDVTLNEGIEEIQSMAFSDCAIKNLDFLPSTVKTIEQFAFLNCPLEEIRYPKEWQPTENIFGNKMSVKTHILPVTLTKIAYYIQAENLYYEGTQEQFASVEKNIKNNVDISTITIYYYAESRADIDDESKNYWHYAEDGKTPVVWD